MAGPRLKGLDYLFVVSLTKMLGSQWVLLQCMKIFIIILIISLNIFYHPLEYFGSHFFPLVHILDHPQQKSTLV